VFEQFARHKPLYAGKKRALAGDGTKEKERGPDRGVGWWGWIEMTNEICEIAGKHKFTVALSIIGVSGADEVSVDRESADVCVTYDPGKATLVTIDRQLAVTA
jgi:hypothetical protein